MEIQLTPELKSQLEDVARRRGKNLADVAEEAIAAWLGHLDWAAEAEGKIEDAWSQAEDAGTRWYSPDESRADLERRKAKHLAERAVG